ncbi:Aste57867_19113 [Aphanomyces stellatus]|uniref:Aste57867_19113 protein n=1 Tax=Aphanomyces stellatus TaxID=120398 RepID=A0A485LDH8_9STRA|nr:hypothetical protein As57867_019049 [Aphanomyces stellatus]VFT95837.1 Aste57867_19113 [Aphanomyces stellatus]
MEVGARVWIEDDAEIWMSGVIEECLDGDYVRARLDEGTTVQRPSSAVVNGKLEQIIHLRNDQDDFRDVPDLISLQYLHEPELLYAVCNRYEHDLIYTYIGEILLSFNPFQRLNIYSSSQVQKYAASSAQDMSLPPHVFAIAANAYKSLCDEKKNQSILVSGESGAGKTENTKFLMQYLTDVGALDASNASSPVPKSKRKAATKAAPPASTTQIQTQILQTNPILEAFGNARTVRNDNSSRFGKFIELQFGAHHKIVGAKLSVYLLEKIRVSHQSADERNFHIFYELCAGADDALAAHLELSDADDFDLLNESGCTTRRDGVDDSDQFALTTQAFTDMGIGDDEQLSIYGIVAALLHLGNVGFDAEVSAASNMEEASIDAESAHHLDVAAKLLGVSTADLTRALITRQVTTTKDKITVQLTPAQALDAKQSLTQSLYGGLFKWIVNRLSMVIRHDSASVNTVGILDIFGFENLHTNGFEQLCINYANERLQAQFNELVFAKEQRMYEAEGIEWKYIEYPDNAPCLQLLEDRPHGMWCLLDEEGMLPKGSNEGWISKLYGIYLEDDAGDGKRRQSCPDKSSSAKPANMPKLARPFFATSTQRVDAQFVIGHFAGRVMYEMDAYLAKNQDALPAEAVELCGSSSNAIVQALLSLAPQPSSKAKPSTKPKRPPPIARQPSSLRSSSVSAQFKSQLDDLIQVIGSTQARYIRCVKSNDVSTPRVLHKARVVQQLRSGGVLEAVRIARAGYAVRVDHLSFLDAFGFFKPKKSKKDTKGLCEQTVAAIMLQFHAATWPAIVEIAAQVIKAAKFDRHAFQEACGLAGFQIGNSKIFFRKDVYNDLRRFRRQTLARHATTIQRYVRGFVARRRAAKMTAAVDVLQTWMRACLAYRARVRASVLRLQSWTRAVQGARQYARVRAALAHVQAWARHMLWMKRLAARVRVRELAKPKVEVAKPKVVAAPPPMKSPKAMKMSATPKPSPILSGNQTDDGGSSSTTEGSADDIVASLTLQNEHLKQELEWLRKQTTTQLQIQMNHPSAAAQVVPMAVGLSDSHHLPPLNELEFAHQQIISLSQQLLVTQIKYSNLLMDYNEQLSGYDADKPTMSEDAFAMVEALDIPCPGSLECAQEQMRSLLRKLHMAKEKLKHLETDMMRNEVTKPSRGESIDAIDFHPRRSSDWRPHFDTIQDWPDDDAASEGDNFEVEHKVEELQRQVDLLRMTLMHKPKAHLLHPPTASTVSTRSSIGSMAEGQVELMRRSFGYVPATPRRLTYHVKDVTSWARADKCFECKVEFGFFTRRHHCRMCSQSFCHEHSNRKACLVGVGSENEDEPVRVCDVCFVEICMESRRQEHQQQSMRRQPHHHMNYAQEWYPDTDPNNFLLNFSQDEVEAQTKMFFGGGHGDNNPFGVNFGFGNNYPQRFDEHYRVYPVSFCDKAHLEDGDKILLPPSALETLARLHIDYPMLFKIKNEGVDRVSHCGVLEFSAPEGSCYMPYWMMQNMFLAEGGIVNIQNVTLPKATFAKIRPQSTDFINITNPRAVLEATLRKFSCMTIGDTISITYNNRNYLLDVRELRPADAVCIIETDCELDFDAPADYVPPVPVAAPAAAAAPASTLPYGGVPTVKTQDVKGKSLGFGGGLRLKKAGGDNTDADAMRAARLKKYEAFHGTGVSVTGVTSATPPMAVAAPPPAPSTAPTAEEKKPAVPFEGTGRRLR